MHLTDSCNSLERSEDRLLDFFCEVLATGAGDLQIIRLGEAENATVLFRLAEAHGAHIDNLVRLLEPTPFLGWLAASSIKEEAGRAVVHKRYGGLQFLNEVHVKVETKLLAEVHFDGARIQIEGGSLLAKLLVLCGVRLLVLRAMRVVIHASGAAAQVARQV